MVITSSDHETTTTTSATASGDRPSVSDHDRRRRHSYRGCLSAVSSASRSRVVSEGDARRSTRSGRPSPMPTLSASVPVDRPEPHDRRLAPHHLPVRPAQHRSPPGGDHARAFTSQQASSASVSALPERLFPVRREHLLHGDTSSRLDLFVGVGESGTRALRPPACRQSSFPIPSSPRARPGALRLPASPAGFGTVFPLDLRCSRRRLVQMRHVRVVVAHDFGHRVATELAQRLCRRARAPASVSATTPIAGTAVTSVRSLNETLVSLVTTSTVPSTGRLRVASGFIESLATTRPPLDIPPSIPPARVVELRYALVLGVPLDRVVRLGSAPRSTSRSPRRSRRPSRPGCS